MHIDICIVSSRPNDKLEKFIENNLKGLTTICVFPNAFDGKYYKLNKVISSEAESEMLREFNFENGYYKSIITNSEFVIFDYTDPNISFMDLHVGIAMGLTKPFFIINSTNVARFSYNILSKTSATGTMEIEKKYLITEDIYEDIIKNGINNFQLHDKLSITQFLTDNDVRYRRQISKSQDSTTYIKNIKSNQITPFSKYEIESFVSENDYETELSNFRKSKVYRNTIRKDRYVFNHNSLGYQLEINKIKVGKKHKFYILEIECANEDLLNSIQINIPETLNWVETRGSLNKKLMSLNTTNSDEVLNFANSMNTHIHCFEYKE